MLTSSPGTPNTSSARTQPPGAQFAGDPLDPSAASRRCSSTCRAQTASNERGKRDVLADADGDVDPEERSRLLGDLGHRLDPREGRLCVASRKYALAAPTSRS
jgi:hypothetical protein